MSWHIDIYELDFVDKTLRKIIHEKEAVFGAGTVTSLYRMGDLGVHGTLPLRGLDERCRHKPLGDMIVEYLNSRWSYDPKRPEMVVCMCHDTGKGLHLHYQSHPNTTRKGG